MKFKTKPAPVEAPEVLLAAQIRAAQAAAAEVVEAHAQAIKSSPEGASLPIDWLRMNIRATTFAGACDCKVALALLAKDQPK